MRALLLLISALLRCSLTFFRSHNEQVIVEHRKFSVRSGSRSKYAYWPPGSGGTVLATRLARVSEFLEDTQFLKLPARLAKKIVDLANHHGRLSSGEKGDELLIDLKLSQGEWGDLVGTTRESINKQFSAWKEKGVITIDDGRLTLTDIDEIEKLANCVML